MYLAFLFFATVVTLGVHGGGANIIPSDTPPNQDGRIVGGYDIKISEAPHQVSVRELSNHICGGSILNSRAILTAAHCFEMRDYYYNIEYGVTYCGSSNNIIWASKIVKHEWYNKDTQDYDIALIFLEKHIPFSNVAKAIPLATQNPLDYDHVRVTGWGALYEGGHVSAVLQSVSIYIKSKSICVEQYKKINKILTDRMLCAGYFGGGKDACQADSGGPLTRNGQLVGVVSWGWGCAREDFFGLYSSVAVLRSWIEKQLNSN